MKYLQSNFKLIQMSYPQGVYVLERITVSMKDQSANCTVVTILTGTMESGAMQTLRPAQMLGPIWMIVFPAMELVMLLVAAWVGIFDIHAGLIRYCTNYEL